MGGQANPTPHLEAAIFKRAADKKPYNDRLEMCIPDTGCTSSCIPLSIAKTHRLKINPVDADEPPMRAFNGSKLNIIGQTKFYLKFKKPGGFTAKKLMHALVIDEAYDREILISWIDCLAFGIISNIFPLPDDTDPENFNNEEDDSSDNESEDESDTESESQDSENETNQYNKNRRVSEAEQPEIFMDVIQEAISRLENKQRQEEDQKEGLDLMVHLLKMNRNQV